LYKLLLCWRYLRTRYLALVCIVSVMLGVATLIVVNSVMSGFSTKLRARLHGLLSDVVLQSWDYDGFADPEGKIALIESDPWLKERIVAMAPTVEEFALLQYRMPDGRPATRVVHLLGIDPERRARIDGFAEHLQREDNKKKPSFELSPEARQHYDEVRSKPQAFGGQRMPAAAFDPIEAWQASQGLPEATRQLLMEAAAARQLSGQPPPEMPKSEVHVPTGLFLGFSIGNVKYKDKNGQLVEERVLQPGDIVKLMTLNTEWHPVTKYCAVADYVRSEMSEYDSSYCFMDYKELQRLRNMEGRATNLLIRLKDYDSDAKVVVDRLRKLFDGLPLDVKTWEELQGPLLAAISIEKGILNILLFMIVGVAGFGILAIFSMIVMEKTRDIGILKALGASNGGVMKIFLGYGLLLGLVGSLLGTGLGVWITVKINTLEKFITKTTGHEIFDRSVYYFNEIPTDMQPWTITMINLGAVAIAVLFSILPALRAAMLHPVRALRYE
jgi:lipoprotein-releasing system permease protein